MLRTGLLIPGHLLQMFLQFFCDNTWQAHTCTRMIYAFSGLVRTGTQASAVAASIHKRCDHNSTAYSEGP